MASKYKLNYYFEYLGLLGAMALLRRLPWSAKDRWGKRLGHLLRRVIPGRERRVKSNLRLAFPQASEDQVDQWAQGCWENLGMTMNEFIRMPTMTQRDLRNFVTVEGMDQIKEILSQGKSVITFTAHYTNWELLPPIFQSYDIPVGVIARRIHNPYVDDLVTGFREHFNIRVIRHRQAVRESMRWLRQGNLLGLLFDQRITEGGVAVPFFDKPVRTTTLPALLALRMQRPVFPVHSWREGSRIRVHIAPPMDLSGLTTSEEDIVEATRRMTQVVEGWVRERPSQWLWLHNRWKP